MPLVLLSLYFSSSPYITECKDWIKPGFGFANFYELASFSVTTNEKGKIVTCDLIDQLGAGLLDLSKLSECVCRWEFIAHSKFIVEFHIGTRGKNIIYIYNDSSTAHLSFPFSEFKNGIISIDHKKLEQLASF